MVGQGQVRRSFFFFFLGGGQTADKKRSKNFVLGSPLFSIVLKTVKHN